MRIIGIDPGLNATGYGIVAAEAEGLRLVVAGAIRPPARRALPQRLGYLYEHLLELFRIHRPALAVLESLYTHHQYLTTATLMAHARGIVCLLSVQQGLPLVEYSPTRVRKALTGNGSASKEQVARMVEARLQARDPSWSSDATDALALAIAHAQISRAAVFEGRRSTRRAARHDVLAALRGGGRAEPSWG